MSILERNRAMCGYCQALQRSNPGEWCIAHQDEPADIPPREMCREEPRRKSICRCRCTRDYDHTGRHYCGDCGWSWGRGKEPTAAEKQAAHA